MLRKVVMIMSCIKGVALVFCRFLAFAAALPVSRYCDNCRRVFEKETRIDVPNGTIQFLGSGTMESEHLRRNDEVFKPRVFKEVLESFQHWRVAYHGSKILNFFGPSFFEMEFVFVVLSIENSSGTVHLLKSGMRGAAARTRSESTHSTGTSRRRGRLSEWKEEIHSLNGVVMFLSEGSATVDSLKFSVFRHKYLAAEHFIFASHEIPVRTSLTSGILDARTFSKLPVVLDF